MRPVSLLLLALAVSAYSGAARADPCEAPVNRYQPGDQFSGQVRYIGDGDSLCVGASADPRQWIEVRLADFDAPELSEPNGPRGKAMLRTLAAGKPARCTAVAGRNGRTVSYDRVIAVCRIEGRSLGDLLRARGAPQGGR